MIDTSKDAFNALSHLRDIVASSLAEAQDLLIVGIANGGIELAEYLHQSLQIEEPSAILNPIFHRDDLGFNPIPKDFQPTQIPFEIEGRDVLLVDDVFASGRTLRASLNELFDHGRPNSVKFACLFDTQQHRFPFAPDFIGESLALKPKEILKVKIALSPTLSCNYQIKSA